MDRGIVAALLLACAGSASPADTRPAAGAPAKAGAKAAVPAKADPKAGERNAQLCLLCHKPSAHAPLLEGQTVPYLVSATDAFRTGARKEPSMTSNVARLSANEIRDIAVWFSAQPLPPHGRALDPAKVAAGEAKAAELKCASCHGADYRGAGPVPRLAGQTNLYLAMQLDAFAAGTRPHADGAPSPKAPADVEALAAWLASLR